MRKILAFIVCLLIFLSVPVIGGLILPAPLSYIVSMFWGILMGNTLNKIYNKLV